MRICEYSQERHLDGLRNCVIELQDVEHAIDSRLPRGADIVDDYLLQMSHRCRKSDGQILIAEIDGVAIGYAMVLTRVRGDGVHDGDMEYGLVADLVVEKKHRDRGIGRELLAAAELYAKRHDVSWLRIGVMTENSGALALYESLGFRSIYTELEKDLQKPAADSRDE